VSYNTTEDRENDIVFCRKRCYLKYMDEWGDSANTELMDVLPGDLGNE